MKRTEDDITIRTGIGWVGKSVNPTYKENRICKEPNCNTVLSIYNKDRYCFFHGTKKLQYELRKEAKLYTRQQGKKNKKVNISQRK